MHRKGFLKNAGISALGIPFFPYSSFKSYGQKKEVISDRQYWINTLTKIIDPVLNSSSKDQVYHQLVLDFSFALHACVTKRFA